MNCPQNKLIEDTYMRFLVISDLMFLDEISIRENAFLQTIISRVENLSTSSPIRKTKFKQNTLEIISKSERQYLCFFEKLDEIFSKQIQEDTICFEKIRKKHRNFQRGVVEVNHQNLMIFEIRNKLFTNSLNSRHVHVYLDTTRFNIGMLFFRCVMKYALRA